MSLTSPPNPTMARELKGFRRLTSVKRASEPYDARLSAAITTPELYLMARTEVPVTIGDCVWVFGVCWAWRVPPWDGGR
jgi:hypothetical protein